MNTIHENLMLCLIEAQQFADRCAYEEGFTKKGEEYSDIMVALGSLIKHGVRLGGEA